MKKGLLKKILIGLGAATFVFVAILCVHIYLVTRPKPADANTIVMARMDIAQPINENDAAKITAWLYQQKGIDHVLVNPASQIAIFTFYPVKTNANLVVQNFQKATCYPASRYMPTDKELQSGCPAMAHTFTGKLTAIVKSVF